jgi:hypothetical protein
MKEAGIHIPDSFHKLPEMFSVVYTQLVEEGVVVGTPEGESPPFAAIPAASVRAWPLEASATPAADSLATFSGTRITAAQAAAALGQSLRHIRV